MWWDCPRLLITSLNYLASFPNLGLYFPFLMASQTPTHPSKPHSDVTSSKNCFPPCMSLRGWLSSFSAFTAQDQHHESPYHVVWKGGVARLLAQHSYWRTLSYSPLCLQFQARPPHRIKARFVK